MDHHVLYAMGSSDRRMRKSGAQGMGEKKRRRGEREILEWAERRAVCC
jgi:hypothetical protein